MSAVAPARITYIGSRYRYASNRVGRTVRGCVGAPGLAPVAADAPFFFAAYDDNIRRIYIGKGLVIEVDDLPDLAVPISPGPADSSARLTESRKWLMCRLGDMNHVFMGIFALWTNWLQQIEQYKQEIAAMGGPNGAEALRLIASSF